MRASLQYGLYTHNAKGEMVDGSREEGRILEQERRVVICRVVLVFLRLYPRRPSPYYVILMKNLHLSNTIKQVRGSFIQNKRYL